MTLHTQLCMLSTCKHISFCTGAMAFSDGRYGVGDMSAPIHLGGLTCNGMEGFLANCTSGSIDGCTHDQDAGLLCVASTYQSIVVATETICTIYSSMQGISSISSVFRDLQ